jgi:hypothetical protein
MPRLRAAQAIRRMCVATLAALAFAASLPLQAAERRFVPVPQGPTQLLQVVEGMTIVAGAGESMDAGASMAPDTARQAWLSVSIRNTGKVPLAIGPGAVVVTSAGAVLAVRPAEAVEAADAEPVTDKCANASASSQINCGIDAFNDKQAARAQPAPAAEATTLAPGAVQANQFQVDLPKKSRAALARLEVRVRAGDEEIAFVFEEVK